MASCARVPSVPIEIEVEERLAAIAEATLRVAEARGADGVTIRAVANELGGSTTLVTNYVPSRAALIRNAIEHTMRRWQTEEDTALEGVPPQDRLEAIALWSCSTTDDDAPARQLFLEMITSSGSPAELTDAIRRDAGEHRDHLRAAAAAASVPDPDLAADLLHLVLRGYYFASAEEPGEWTSERVSPIVERLVALLRTATPAHERPEMERS